MSAADWAVQGAEQMVRSLWAEGLSASQIRTKLATIGVWVSRNAVIGKVHRLGCAGRANPHRTYGTAPKRPRKPKLIVLPAKRSAPAIVRDDGACLRRPPAPSATSIRFLDLKPGQCKMFCEGEDGPEGLCCGENARGSWCKKCEATVFNPNAWGAKTRRMA